jgi:hypothetical protein
MVGPTTRVLGFQLFDVGRIDTRDNTGRFGSVQRRGGHRGASRCCRPSTGTGPIFRRARYRLRRSLKANFRMGAIAEWFLR